MKKQNLVLKACFKLQTTIPYTVKNQNGVHFLYINFSLKLCSLKAAETLQINTDSHGQIV